MIKWYLALKDTKMSEIPVTNESRLQIAKGCTLTTRFNDSTTQTKISCWDSH